MRRPVTVYEWRNPPGAKHCEKMESGKGFFVQYGVDFEEFEYGPGCYTTAIVEMPDGTVKNLSVDMIRFDDASEIGMAILNIDIETREKLQAVIDAAVDWLKLRRKDPDDFIGLSIKEHGLSEACKAAGIEL